MGRKLMYVGKQMIGDLSPREYLCDTDADLATLPEACTGSTAVSLESGKVYVVSTFGNWIPFGEGYVEKEPLESVVGTWVFNDIITTAMAEGDVMGKERCAAIGVDFTSYESFPFNGGKYDSIGFYEYIESTDDGDIYITRVLKYGRSGPSTQAYDFVTNTWLDESAKTIIITGDVHDSSIVSTDNITGKEFIAWLKENATKVG